MSTFDLQDHQPCRHCHSSLCHDACGEFEEAAPAAVSPTPAETLQQHGTSATASQFPPQLSLTDTLILKSAHMRGVPMFLRSCSQRPQLLDWVRVWGSCTDFHKWGLFEPGSFLHQSTVDALHTGSCESTQHFCCCKMMELSPFVPCSLQWKCKVMLITESDKPTVMNWSARSAFTQCLSYI